jgi:hypothetical protein
MMKRFLALATLMAVAFVALSPSIARAVVNGVTIENHTSKCAWITVYTSDRLDPTWSIFKGRGSEPQFLKPGAKYTFMMVHSEVKIRAEVKQNADCTGHNIADTYDIRKDYEVGGRFYSAGLFNNNHGGYNLWFK